MKRKGKLIKFTQIASFRPNLKNMKRKGKIIKFTQIASFKPNLMIFQSENVIVS